jgi:hypothetical protein
MSDHEGRDEDAKYEAYQSRRRGSCEECGCYGEHDPLCPWAPDADHDGDGDIVQGTISFTGELLREVRDAA